MYTHTHTHTHTHTTSFVTSKIAIAVATILGATCVQAAVAAGVHTFDEQSNTHIWHWPDNPDGVFFPETTELKNGQNVKFNTTSSRWLLKDFKEGFAYSLGKVQFTNAPSDGTHKFFAVIDGSNAKDQSHPLDPNKTYLTIDELRLGLNTALQFSSNVNEKTVDIRKLVISCDIEEGRKLSEYDLLKNAVNIQTYNQIYKGPVATSNSIRLNEVVVEDGASVTFSAKGNEQLGRSHETH